MGNLIQAMHWHISVEPNTVVQHGKESPTFNTVTTHITAGVKLPEQSTCSC